MGWHLKSDTFSKRRYRRLAGNGKTCYYPDIGAGGWQTTEKSTMKRECFVLRHERSLFFNYYGIIGTRLGSSKSAFEVKTRSLRSEIGVELRLAWSQIGQYESNWDWIEVIGVRKSNPSGTKITKGSFFFVRENKFWFFFIILCKEELVEPSIYHWGMAKR